jgi:hypothetical protein
LNDQLLQDLLKAFATSGPFGLGFYFLGRTVLKAWEEDRTQLRTVAAQTLAVLQQTVTILDRVARLLDNMEARKQP